MLSAKWQPEVQTAVSRRQHDGSSFMNTAIPHLRFFGNVHSNVNVKKNSSIVSPAGNVCSFKLFTFALPSIEPNSSIVHFHTVLGAATSLVAN